MFDDFEKDNDSRKSSDGDDLSIRSEIELEHGTVSFVNEDEVRRVLIIDNDSFPSSAAEYEAILALRALSATKTAVFLAVIARQVGWVLIERAGYGVLFDRLGDLVSAHSQHFVYEPHLEAFFQKCEEYRITDNGSFGEAFAEYARTEIEVDALWLRIQFLSDLQKALQSAEFKKALAARRKAAKRIRAAFRGLWRRVFAKRARVMVVCVDFEYALSGYPEGFHPLYSPLTPDRFLLEVFLADRDRFINNLRDLQQPGGFAEHLLGWGWKLECGQKRGWHIHAVFFFDASRVKNAWYMAEMLGDLWMRLTDGRGSYFNLLNSDRDYQQVFLGEIHRGDSEAEAGYLKYVEYLAKDDQIPVVKTSRKLQMFAVSRGRRHAK